MIDLIAITAALALLSDRQQERARSPRGRILRPGRLMYHGTIEDFEDALYPGVDGLVWFADTPRVAQLYIPTAGSSMLTSSQGLVRPSFDPDVRKIQAAIGIVYDLDFVRWNRHNEPDSWRSPVGMEDMPTREWISEQLQALGFESGERGQWFRFHKGRLMMPGERVMGRVFITEVTRPLVLFNLAGPEGDLGDPSHLWISAFKKAEAQGFDGVIINDHAQSKAWGNLSHFSVGLFPRGLTGIATRTMPAGYQEFSFTETGVLDVPEEQPTFFRELALERKMG